MKNLCKDWHEILDGKHLLTNLFTVLSVKMINLRTSRPKYRLFPTFLGKYGPFFDDFFQVGPYTDFLRKYGPLYKHCLGISQAYLKHISDISQVYIRHILGLSHA